MGLLLGASCLTIFEYFDVIVLNGYYKIMNYWNKRKNAKAISSAQTSLKSIESSWSNFSIETPKEISV